MHLLFSFSCSSVPWFLQEPPTVVSNTPPCLDRVGSELVWCWSWMSDVDAEIQRLCLCCQTEEGSEASLRTGPLPLLSFSLLCVSLHSPKDREHKPIWCHFVPNPRISASTSSYSAVQTRQGGLTGLQTGRSSESNKSWCSQDPVSHQWGHTGHSCDWILRDLGKT